MASFTHVKIMLHKRHFVGFDSSLKINDWIYYTSESSIYSLMFSIFYDFSNLKIKSVS